MELARIIVRVTFPRVFLVLEEEGTDAFETAGAHCELYLMPLATGATDGQLNKDSHNGQHLVRLLDGVQISIMALFTNTATSRISRNYL
jgi:hypothetical protein